MPESTAGEIDFDRPKAMPRDPAELREVIKDYLEARREAGFSYVKTDDIRRDLEWDPMPQKIGQNLAQLDKEGVLEKWSSGPGATFRITMDETGRP